MSTWRASAVSDTSRTIGAASNTHSPCASGSGPVAIATRKKTAAVADGVMPCSTRLPIRHTHWPAQATAIRLGNLRSARAARSMASGVRAVSGTRSQRSAERASASATAKKAARAAPLAFNVSACGGRAWTGNRLRNAGTTSSLKATSIARNVANVTRANPHLRYAPSRAGTVKRAETEPPSHDIPRRRALATPTWMSLRPRCPFRWHSTRLSGTAPPPANPSLTILVRRRDRD